MKPASDAITAMRASMARIESKAAELMVAHEDVSVDACVSAAAAYEVALYGLWTDTDLRPIVGKSPIQSLMEKYCL